MKPTYSTAEVLQLIEKFQDDYDGLEMICDLVIEEKKRYSLYDLDLIRFYYTLVIEIKHEGK